MFVTIRAKGYLVENKYFEDPVEATKFVSEQQKEVDRYKWSISYKINSKRDTRIFVDPKKELVKK